MITITKNGNAVLFEFEENSHYLYNGTIEVPLNSLSLVTDESEMFTFKKAATNDIFISARYDDVNMSKSQLIDFYIANMVGSGNSESGITSGDVQTMIETSLEDYYDIDEIDAALSGKADTSAVTEEINSAVSGKADTSAVTEAITAAVSGKQDTLIAGSGITISGNVISSEGGNNVIELTQAEYDALVTGGTVDPSVFYIITDAQEINISDYYTSAQTQSAINAAVSGKQDTLIAGSGITISSGNVISADGGGKTIEGGRGITVTTGETADTVSFDLPISAGSGSYSVAEGYNTVATGLYSHAEGRETTSATYAHSEGYRTVANGYYSHAEGLQSAANGGISHAEGSNTVTYNGFEHASGIYNTSVSASTTFGDSGNTLFSVGNGYKNARHNAFEVRQNGEIYIADTNDTSTSNYYEKPMIKLQDALGGGGGVSESAFTSYSAATDARLSEDEEVTAAAFNALNDELSAKQDTLVAGDNITISGNVISAEGGIDSGTVQTMIDGSISGKADTSDVTVAINSAVSGKADTSAVTEISSAVSGKMDTSVFNTYSAATDARISEDEEVTAAALNALNDKFDGLRLKKLTQAEYEALTVKDNNTLFILVG